MVLLACVLPAGLTDLPFGERSDCLRRRFWMNGDEGRSLSRLELKVLVNEEIRWCGGKVTWAHFQKSCIEEGT
jgi:hypothetical protein